MSWYANQKARHEAKLAGEERPRTGGIGDKVADALQTRVDEAGRLRAESDAAKGAKRAAKDARRAVRRGETI